MSILVDHNVQSISDLLDRRLDSGFEQASLRRKKNIDLWAAEYALGGKAEYRLISNFLGQGNPVVLFEEVRKFYEEQPVRTSIYPFSAGEAAELFALLDKQAGGPFLEYLESEHWGLMSSGWDLCGAGQCVGDIAYSLLFFPHGIAYVPSHSSQSVSGYSKTFSQIDEELRKNANLRDAFKATIAEESIKYLLGEKLGQLNELLGFTPLNPLELMKAKSVSDDQIQEAILKIRRDCKKIRGLFEKVHLNCLNQDIDSAVEAKRNLADLRANSFINYSILDHVQQFIDRSFEDAVHNLIDKMLESETNSRLTELTKHLKKFKHKSSLLSEAKFLTFGAMMILASYGLPAPQIKEVFDVLGHAGLTAGGVGVMLRLLEKGIKLHPGFNLYASFVDWPRIT
jgi:hypothetical protein